MCSSHVAMELFMEIAPCKLSTFDAGECVSENQFQVLEVGICHRHGKTGVKYLRCDCRMFFVSFSSCMPAHVALTCQIF
jgi:hypothetical protein